MFFIYVCILVVFGIYFGVKYCLVNFLRIEYLYDLNFKNSVKKVKFGELFVEN